MVESLYLIDGSALAYRSHFAFIRNPLVNSRGENTSAVFGFANTLLKVLRKYQPDHLVIAFDTSLPTFRHQQHPDYKATREKMPEELAEQLPRIHQLAAAMHIPLLVEEGFEADDIIGTLAVKAVEAGMEVTVVSGDKDFMQLVGPQVRLLQPGRAADDYSIVDMDGVRQRLGVEPHQVIEVMGLMGDTSDNVPGVPGVGQKTAARLVTEHGTMEAVLAHAPQLTQKKLREKLIEHADQARLSRQLVTICTDCPVELDLQITAVRAFDRGALGVLLRELEFNRLLEQLGLETEAGSSPRDVAYELVTTAHRLTELVETLRACGHFAFDLETTSLDVRQARIVGIALAWEEGRAAYVSIGHTRGDNVPLDAAMELLAPLLADPQVTKCGQNLKFDTAILKWHGYQTQGIVCDTMIADYLLDPGARQHGLNALAQRHLHYTMQPISELIGKGREQTDFAAVEPQQASFYACEDADITLRLQHVLMPAVAAQEMDMLLQRVELPLIAVLRDMELTGVAVDTGFLHELSGRLGSRMEDLGAEIHAMAGKPFNINSTQQLALILFDKLGLKPKRKTKTGFSTDVTVLEELAQVHPLPQRVLEYRELYKLRSTYVDALPGLVHPVTGRIHTSFNQAVTATGRLSSSDPNLQNIPIRTQLGREIRKAFVPGREDGVIFSVDYSQIELRLLAHLSGDEQLSDAFRAGEDIHLRTASLLFNLLPEYITPEMRAQAKTVNFGIIYGQTPFGLSRQLGITVPQAQDFIDSYFAVYSRVRQYMAETVQQARADGFVTTILGRRRYLPDINSSTTRRREFAERTAINSPIQGSQADMIKLAMISIHRGLQERQLDAAVILQVHDELVLEVGWCDRDAVEELVRTEMVSAMPLDVPVVVEAGCGANWYEAH